jgi:hypothetical protein
VEKLEKWRSKNGESKFRKQADEAPILLINHLPLTCFHQIKEEKRNFSLDIPRISSGANQQHYCRMSKWRIIEHFRERNKTANQGLSRITSTNGAIRTGKANFC